MKIQSLGAEVNLQPFSGWCCFRWDLNGRFFRRKHKAHFGFDSVDLLTAHNKLRQNYFKSRKHSHNNDFQPLLSRIRNSWSSTAQFSGYQASQISWSEKLWTQELRCLKVYSVHISVKRNTFYSLLQGGSFIGFFLGFVLFSVEKWSDRKYK